MEAKEEENVGLFEMSCAEELVEDLKREFFDVHFELNFSSQQWLKTLRRKQCCGVQQKNITKTTGGKTAKPLLNNATHGRICHLFSLTPSQYNSIFGSAIRSSDIPSSFAAYHSFGERDDKSDAFHIVKRILIRHNIPIIPKTATAEDLDRIGEEMQGKIEEKIQEHQLQLSKLQSDLTQTKKNYAQASDCLRKKAASKTLSAQPQATSPQSPPPAPQPSSKPSSKSSKPAKTDPNQRNLFE